MSHRSRKTMQTPSSECGRGRGRGREEPRERGNSKMPVGEGHEAFLFLSKGVAVAVAVFGMDRTEVLMQHTRQSLPRVRFRGEDAESRAEGAALPIRWQPQESGVRLQVVPSPESRVPSPDWLDAAEIRHLQGQSHGAAHGIPSTFVARRTQMPPLRMLPFCDSWACTNRDGWWATDTAMVPQDSSTSSSAVLSVLHSTVLYTRGQLAAANQCKQKERPSRSDPPLRAVAQRSVPTRCGK
jgi:hypothetical protein